MGKANYTREEHKQSKSRTYICWQSAKNRAFNVNGTDYQRYGGRGITMCQEWKDSFLAFLKDMGHVPDGYTLERIDNDGNYEPGNCKWANRKEQSNNTARNRYITYNDKTQTLAQWADEYGIEYMLLFNRLELGWTMDDALTRVNRLTREFTKEELSDIKKLLEARVNVHKIGLKYNVHYSKITKLKPILLPSDPK